MNPLPITDADVNAYVDGQLAPSRAPAMEEALARDPALAARVAELRKQNALLRDAFDPWLAEPLPRTARRGHGGQRAGAPPRRRVARPRGRPPRLRSSSASGLGWYGRELSLQREGTPTTFTRQAALVHVAVRERRQSPGRDLGRGRGTAGAMAVAAAGLPGARARSQFARLRARRRAAGRRQRECRRRCSSTRTPTSSG